MKTSPKEQQDEQDQANWHRSLRLTSCEESNQTHRQLLREKTSTRHDKALSSPTSATRHHSSTHGTKQRALPETSVRAQSLDTGKPEEVLRGVRPCVIQQSTSASLRAQPTSTCLRVKAAAGTDEPSDNICGENPHESQDMVSDTSQAPSKPEIQTDASNSGVTWLATHPWPIPCPSLHGRPKQHDAHDPSPRSLRIALTSMQFVLDGCCTTLSNRNRRSSSRFIPAKDSHERPGDARRATIARIHATSAKCTVAHLRQVTVC